MTPLRVTHLRRFIGIVLPFLEVYSNIIRELHYNLLIMKYEQLFARYILLLLLRYYCMHGAWFLEVRSTVSTVTVTTIVTGNV